GEPQLSASRSFCASPCTQIPGSLHKRQAVPQSMELQYVAALRPARHTAERAGIGIDAQAGTVIVVERTYSRAPQTAADHAQPGVVEVTGWIGQPVAQEIAAHGIS